MKPHVLIIEPSLTIRMALHDAFELEGFEATHCGTAAAARLELERRPVSIVILDELVPDADAGAFLEELHARPGHAAMPILFLSSLEAPPLRERAAPALRSTVWVHKPYGIDQLVSRAASLVREQSPTVHSSSVAVRPTGGGEGAGIARSGRVLLVDDSETYRHAVAASLQPQGYQMILARSGAEALELLAQHAVDAILLDVHLPDLSGHEICRRIKADPEWHGIPLIMLTARDDAVVAALEAGADDFVAKASDMDVLAVRLRSHLRRKHFQDETRRMREELLRQEMLAAEARAAHELAEIRARLLADLEQKNAALIRAQEQREEMAALLVHDLKNPLSVILLGARMVQLEPALTDRGRRMVDKIATAANAMQRMILNLLDISRSEDGALMPQRSAVDLKALVTELIDLMERRGEASEQKLMTRIETARTQIHADPDMLRRVLENLVDNAIKFTPPREVIELVARDGASSGIEIRVCDAGPGVPEEQRDRIFDKYVQLEANDMPATVTGRGMGLRFCRLAVEAHGGRIWVEDNVPRGSCFCIWLPIDRSYGA